MPVVVNVRTCERCGCGELFVRKNFPQRLGMLIVVLAGSGFVLLAARRETFYLGVGVLAAAVVIDMLLYFCVGKIAVCYRCRAEAPLRPGEPPPEPFELAVAEKYRSIPAQKLERTAAPASSGPRRGEA